MRAEAVHSAPSGLDGMSMCHWGSIAAGTSIVNAMDSPSGAHSRFDGDSVTRVTWLTAPSSSIQRTKICGPSGSPGATYAIRLPSGDQTGDEPSTR
jgi:hypothetical protein